MCALWKYYTWHAIRRCKLKLMTSLPPLAEKKRNYVSYKLKVQGASFPRGPLSWKLVTFTRPCSSPPAYALAIAQPTYIYKISLTTCYPKLYDTAHFNNSQCIILSSWRAIKRQNQKPHCAVIAGSNIPPMRTMVIAAASNYKAIDRLQINTAHQLLLTSNVLIKQEPAGVASKLNTYLICGARADRAALRENA